MQESSEQQTFLLDDVEVVLTGRVAKRELKNNKIDERVEITPRKSAEGSWKKWVRRAELYKIEKEAENDETIS